MCAAKLTECFQAGSRRLGYRSTTVQARHDALIARPACSVPEGINPVHSDTAGPKRSRRGWDRGGSGWSGGATLATRRQFIRLCDRQKKRPGPKLGLLRCGPAAFSSDWCGRRGGPAPSRWWLRRLCSHTGSERVHGHAILAVLRSGVHDASVAAIMYQTHLVESGCPGHSTKR
jgi:hypothetical protein